MMPRTDSYRREIRDEVLVLKRWETAQGNDKAGKTMVTCGWDTDLTQVAAEVELVGQEILNNRFLKEFAAFAVDRGSLLLPARESWRNE